MATPPTPQADEDIVRAWHVHRQALIDGDTDTLDRTLAQAFTLTHMSGRVQPKQEWLAQMRDGQFDYHSVQEKNVHVHVDGDNAHLVARTVTDATVYGTRAPWHLQLALDFTTVDGRWIAQRAVGTSW
ncbi:nuclear transport factor 2 family protein [Streptacidiphilus sp. EB103A]|uniref:nuclear transport factor 2 family protein n=1 Tax=Streptacidiphilus sp. EB103A TaxID=3156275 RepID=UPI0035192B3C